MFMLVSLNVKNQEACGDILVRVLQNLFGFGSFEIEGAFIEVWLKRIWSMKPIFSETKISTAHDRTDESLVHRREYPRKAFGDSLIWVFSNYLKLPKQSFNLLKWGLLPSGGCAQLGITVVTSKSHSASEIVLKELVTKRMNHAS